MQDVRLYLLPERPGMDHSTIGTICALSAALVWAFAMILFKLSGENVPPLALNLFKNTIAMILLAATLAAIGQGFDEISAFPASDIWILILSGLIGITLADTIFFYSLNLCGVGITSLVDCLYSPFIILFSFLLLAEELTGLQYFGAGLILLAVAITSGNEPPRGRTRGQLLAGIGLGVLNMALMGYGIVLAKPVLEHFPIVWATAIRMAAGTVALALIILALPGRRALFAVFKPSRSWKVSIPGSVLGAYLACVLWIGGFKFSDASVASILNQSSSIFALVLAALLLKEKFTLRKLYAVIIAMGGILLVTLG
jgi:drug/metabolite transporter (DMT)-like permease